MATRTQDDYADMVNPYVRAEQEAEQRGFRKGVLLALWWVCCAVIIGMLLVSIKAHAAPGDWSFEETKRPIQASERDASITVCQNNAVRYPWHCFSVR